MRFSSILWLLVFYSHQIVSFTENSFESFDGYKLHYCSFIPDTPKHHVVVLPGRAASYKELAFFLKRLYEKDLAVFMFDPRGTGKNTRLVLNSNAQHIDSFDEYILDLKAFINHLNKPVHLLGGSHGGHVGLRFCIDMHKQCSSRVLSLTTLCPMVEFYTSILPFDLAKHVSNAAWLLGFDQYYAFSKGDTNVDNYLTDLKADKAIDENIVSDMEKQLTNDVLVGGPTFGWVSQAICSVKELQKTITSLKTKTFMILSQEDGKIKYDSQLKLYEAISTKKELLIFSKDNQNGEAPHDFFYAKQKAYSHFLNHWLKFIEPDDIELDEHLTKN